MHQHDMHNEVFLEPFCLQFEVIRSIQISFSE